MSVFRGILSKVGLLEALDVVSVERCANIRAKVGMVCQLGDWAVRVDRPSLPVVWHQLLSLVLRMV